MTELTGFPELTPYGGGWCGNDVFATALTERQRQLAREYTQRDGRPARARRGTAATSSSTSSPTPTRASCTSASSTRA